MMRAALQSVRCTLWIAVGAAAGSLGQLEVAPAWAAALMLPAAICVPMQVQPSAWYRVLPVVILQILLAWGAYAWVGPLGHPAGLACMLLPPLVFFAVRARPSDVQQALFLSLCLLLIGNIVGPGVPLLLFVVYLASAVLTLEALGRPRLDAVAGRARPSVRLRTRVVVVLTTLLACVGSFQLLRALPSAGMHGRPPPHRIAASGITESFDLAGKDGMQLSLSDETMLAVRGIDEPPPSDLYLRCAHFDVADLDHWSTMPTRLRPIAVSDAGSKVSEPLAGLPMRELSLAGQGPLPTELLVPPGTFRIRFAHGLRGDLAAACFRSHASAYEVTFQDLRSFASGRRVDPRWKHLTELPPSLQRADLAELARTLARGSVTPAGIARVIAEGLQVRCRYSLEEPSGPHALLDFLFGERRGSCMHFASALATLLRLRGVACRIAGGLQGGDADPSDPMLRTFGAQHAHAWVEIPFEGLGWVVFDATPSSMERPRPGREEAGQRDTPETSHGSLWSELHGATLGEPWLLGAAGALVLLWFFGRPRAASAPAVLLRREARAAGQLLGAIAHELAGRGHGRREGETLEAWWVRIAPHVGEHAAALREAFDAYQEVRFGGRALDAERQAQLLRGRSAARSVGTLALTPA